MPREMPILKHRGDKLLENKSFWSVPQDIMVYAFNNLTYNETQVLIYLMGNKPADGDYQGWQISNINDTVGGTDRTIRASRQSLDEMGFIHQIPGQTHDTYVAIVVDFDWIREVINNGWDKATAKQKYKEKCSGF